MAEAKKILAIDDDPDILESVKAILDGNGFETVTAASGSEGLDAYKSGKPDLILCDMMMEHVDEGTKVAAKIREEDTQIPIYLLSSIGDATASNINPGDLGFNGVIQKPVDPDSLVSIVKKALKM
ncbi:MAG: response regulator [bacterium]|nr:response regulator [bacterium]